MVDQLEKQVTLAQELLEIEKQKRIQILSAGGKQLKSLTEKSEVLMKEFHTLEEKRALYFEKLVGKHANYTMILQYLTKSDEPESAQTESFLAQLKTLTIELKTEIEENQQLLEKANGSIEKILGAIKTESGKTETYSPERGNRSKRQAMVLSTSA